MECIQNEKSLNTSINKLNWRFNYMFSDHKPGLLLYARAGRTRMILKKVTTLEIFDMQKVIIMLIQHI